MLRATAVTLLLQLCSLPLLLLLLWTLFFMSFVFGQSNVHRSSVTLKHGANHHYDDEIVSTVATNINNRNPHYHRSSSFNYYQRQGLLLPPSLPLLQPPSSSLPMQTIKDPFVGKYLIYPNYRGEIRQQLRNLFQPLPLQLPPMIIDAEEEPHIFSDSILTYDTRPKPTIDHFTSSLESSPIVEGSSLQPSSSEPTFDNVKLWFKHKINNLLQHRKTAKLSFETNDNTREIHHSNKQDTKSVSNNELYLPIDINLLNPHQSQISTISPDFLSEIENDHNDSVENAENVHQHFVKNIHLKQPSLSVSSIDDDGNSFLSSQSSLQSPSLLSIKNMNNLNDDQLSTLFTTSTISPQSKSMSRHLDSLNNLDIDLDHSETEKKSMIISTDCIDSDTNTTNKLFLASPMTSFTSNTTTKPFLTPTKNFSINKSDSKVRSANLLSSISASKITDRLRNLTTSATEDAPAAQRRILMAYPMRRLLMAYFAPRILRFQIAMLLNSVIGEVSRKFLDPLIGNLGFNIGGGGSGSARDTAQSASQQAQSISSPSSISLSTLSQLVPLLNSLISVPSSSFLSVNNAENSYQTLTPQSSRSSSSLISSTQPYPPTTASTAFNLQSTANMLQQSLNPSTLSSLLSQLTNSPATNVQQMQASEPTVHKVRPSVTSLATTSDDALAPEPAPVPLATIQLSPRNVQALLSSLNSSKSLQKLLSLEASTVTTNSGSDKDMANVADDE